MPDQVLNSIDDYEVFLTETMTRWSPQQRVALAAGMAERWLPAYESFSAQEKWGDTASLRRALEAVWEHIKGRKLTTSDIARYANQVHEITPHLDDFDAEEALTACAILTDALRSCGEPDRAISHVLGAILGVFEGLVGEWPVETAAQRKAWNKRVVRKELQAQLKLIEAIDPITAFDGEGVGLRSRIAGLKIKPEARSEPKGPSKLTNQTIFEQYRRFVESDLKGQVIGEDPPPGSFLFAMTYLGYWMGRYSRRLQSINGSYGLLADEPGQQALVARNHAVDALAKGSLAWDSEVREAVEICLQNNSLLRVLDAGSIETPHGYGPSLRRLWLEGRRLGSEDQDGWNHVLAWASHRPAVWEVENRRKKKGMVHSTPEMGDRLAQEITWTRAADPLFPWSATVEEVSWRIRINDFPDEMMYSLFIGNKNAGVFHDWPETWRR